MARLRKDLIPEVELRESEVISLRDALVAIPDYREEKKPRYTLAILITMLVYSVLCDNVGATGAERYCKLHAEFFTKVFNLKTTPSLPIFSKVIKLVDRDAVAEVVASWVETCSPDIKAKYIALCEIHAFEKAEREAAKKMEVELRDAEINSLSEALEKIPDFREARGIRYPLIALIVMMIYAALCGHFESDEIEVYCNSHKDYFTKMFNLKCTPSHDTFDRLKRLLNPKLVAIPLQRWIKTCFPDIRERFNDCFLLHIDGKAVRAASEKQNGEAARYLLNAMFEGESIGLSMLEVGRKKNESSEIVNFLDFFNLVGVIVTADAAATTEDVINKIVDGGGEYVLPIKGNQGKTEEAIINTVETLLASPAKNPSPEVKTMYDECKHIVYKPKRQHGREEVITCTLLDTKAVLKELLDEKPFLKTAAHVAVIDKESTAILNGKEKTTPSRRIFIVSLKNITPEDVRRIVEAHWHIESSHWLLDVQLREDFNTSRSGYAMEFGATMRRLSLMLWKFCQGSIDKDEKRKTLKAFLIRNQGSEDRIAEILASCPSLTAAMA